MKAMKGPMQRLIEMTGDDWRYVIAATIGSIAAGWLNPMIALILASVVADYYNPDQRYMRKDISKFSLLFVGLGLFCIIIYNLQHYSLGVLGERLVNRIRETLFASKHEPLLLTSCRPLFR